MGDRPEGCLAMFGEASMHTNNHNIGTVLDGPSALDDLLNANGDPALEPMLPPHAVTVLGEQLHAYLMNKPVPGRFIQLLAGLDGNDDRRHGE